MKDLSYTTFFNKEKVSHAKALRERIISSIIQIITEEKGISEKSFTIYDEVMADVNNRFNDDMFNISNDMYNDDKRIKYISEYLYDKFFKEPKINESSNSASDGGEVYNIPTQLNPNLGPNSIGKNVGSTNINKSDISNKSDTQMELPTKKVNSKPIKKTLNTQKYKQDTIDVNPRILNWDEFQKDKLKNNI